MKGMPVTVTFCCVQFWITRTKNARDFEGTRELVAREYQVAFELYHRLHWEGSIWVSSRLHLD